MKKIISHLSIWCIVAISLTACKKKTDQDRAIDLVKAKYSDQALNFDQSKLDSLYNIAPMAYADSLKKGDELDERLAGLESEIEHYSQQESDSVGKISAALTKERYKLLDLAKTKPVFKGWTLSGVQSDGGSSKNLSFNFDAGITRIMP